MTDIALRCARRKDGTETFIGRESVCDLLDDLASSVTGGGAAVVIYGEAGVGKTALLRRVTQRTSARQRWIGGSEAEAVLPFACAADLLTPLRHDFVAVPPAQRRALEVAFALEDGPPPSMLAICAGALGVLAAAGDADPLVIFVDDLQWMDPESRQLLMFVARRLVTERVVIVFALRSEVGKDLLANGLPALRLEGLTPAECQILARTRYPPLRDGELDYLISATGGNPHALLESLAGWGPTTHPDDVTIGLDVRKAWQQLLTPLPADTRHALFALAAGDAPGLPSPPVVLEALGLSLSDLEPAERLGLLRVSSDRLTLRYPLLRQVLVDATPLGVMQSTYQTLAELAPPEQRAWLLAKAVIGPDRHVADALLAAACEARRRGGHATASELALRSAELTACPDERAARLLVAAADSLAGGKPARTERCCADALALRSDPEFVGSATGLRCRALMWMGQAAEAADQLVTTADRMPAAQAPTAARLLRDALIPLAMCGAAGRCLTTAQRSEQLSPATDATPHHKVMLASAYLLVGRVTEGRARLEVAERALAEADSGQDGHALVSLAQARWLVEDFDADLISRTIEGLRSDGSSAVMGLALAIRAELGIRTGRWASAYADAVESVQWATELHQPGMLGYAQVLAARIEAARGDRAQCEERVDRARRAAGKSSPASLAIHCAAVLGLAALAQGEPEEAAEQLRVAWRHARDQALGHPDVVPFVGDLIEAHFRAGQPGQGHQVLRWLDDAAGATGLAHTGALAARCRGLLAEDQTHADAAFAAARADHDRCPMPFERARTLLCEGEMLRRTRRLIAARSPLREAQLIFEGLGARPWAERTARELAASGARTRHTDPASAGIDALTPHELQIARMVAVGKNNSEAAAALFVSRKTVEAHLTRIYRKLGLGSRTELTRAMLALGLAD